MTDQRALLEKALLQLRETRARLASAERARREPVAVLGTGVRFPGGVTDLASYWALLRDGVDAATPMVDTVDGHRPPPEEREVTGRWAGLLDRVDAFDAGFFGISAGEAARMDPQQRLVLEVAWEAIEDAGLPLPELRRRTTGVFLGVYGSDYLSMQFTDPSIINTYTAPGGAHSVLANRVSYLLDLHGPSLAVDTACSSSLMAVHLAVRALRQGDCDLALAGGVNLLISPLSTLVTEKVLPIAPGGRCRPFDAAADGIIRAEGCGLLVLTRESLAAELVPGGRPRAIIRGTAANHDGSTNGLTAPNPRAQAALLRRALADAGASPGEVGYVEAHGTGTPLGDPIEMEALLEVYGSGDRPCVVGAVKSNFGHQEAAAGIAGLVKAMLVLEHRQVPPTLHLRDVNPEIDLTGSRLRLAAETVPLPEGDTPTLAAVSSFGFGGANVHAILQAPPAEPVPEADRPVPASAALRLAGSEAGTATATPASATAPLAAATGSDASAPGRPGGRFVLPISARSSAALGALARSYAELLDGVDPAEAARVCAAAGARRSHLSHRLCVVAEDAAGLVRELGRVSVSGVRPIPARPPRVAFVFSGQGSQWAGMGAELIEREPVWRAEVFACDEIVRELAGWSIVDEITSPDPRLNETEVAQLCVAAYQLGLAALWRSWGVTPYAVTGHSMGEVVAAHVAGMLTREQAFRLLLQRARRTEEGARKGAMCHIRLPRDEVEELIAGDPRVAIGAVNAPRSTVVSGERASVDRVAEAAERRGARVTRLPVEYGFHSPLLDGHAERLADEVAGIVPAPGELPFFSTVTGTRLRADALDGGHWARNLRDAVMFAPAVEALAEAGVTVFVEVGPHPVLVRDIGETLDAAGVRHLAVAGPRRDRSAVAGLERALADVYRAGVEVDWPAVLGVPAGRVPLPGYPWQRDRYWLPVSRPQPVAVAASAGRAAAGVAAEGPAVPAPAPPGDVLDGAAGESEADRVEALTLYVRRHVAAALNLDDLDAVPADAPLHGYSLDSLVIVELKNQVENEFGVSVPLQALLELHAGGTAADLAAAIIAADGGSGAGAGGWVRDAVAGG